MKPATVEVDGRKDDALLEATSLGCSVCRVSNNNPFEVVLPSCRGPAVVEEEAANKPTPNWSPLPVLGACIPPPGADTDNFAPPARLSPPPLADNFTPPARLSPPLAVNLRPPLSPSCVVPDPS